MCSKGPKGWRQWCEIPKNIVGSVQGTEGGSLTEFLVGKIDSFRFSGKLFDMDT